MTISIDALSEPSPALRKLLAEANAAACEVGRAIVTLEKAQARQTKSHEAVQSYIEHLRKIHKPQIPRAGIACCGGMGDGSDCAPSCAAYWTKQTTSPFKVGDLVTLSYDSPDVVLARVKSIQPSFFNITKRTVTVTCTRTGSTQTYAEDELVVVPEP